MSDQTNAIVIQRIEVSSGLIILRVRPDGWELPGWKSGQFAILGLPVSAPRVAMADEEERDLEPDKILKRAYSISSASQERDYLEFFITLVHSGALTPRLFQLQVGDRVWLGERIKGLFTLNKVPEDSNLVFVGTGTGLAPFMSMLRSELECTAERQVAVLLGARHSWDLGYRGELQAMQRYCPFFHYLPTISRPDEELAPWSGNVGYVQDLWRGGALEKAWGGRPGPENTHVLLCGAPNMIESMLTVLQEDGFQEHTRRNPGQVHAEKYW
ncbi:ferredoxin--NADP(+) reductase [bacterium DOLJORAL78_65_58]|nr:MAG: ferredoxin--NADP(+) reductase [bacterium DOLZORAL124_64_63]PIE76420.1 MAG: ferredoxin--NADP(+) reductase [bacterium DOLJORAL78_65_58]